MFFAGFCTKVCVASTCSTSLVPIPNAKAPNAPWVAVWLSPQTTVIPGSVKPCSGPTTCTMPWRESSMPKYSTPNSDTFCSNVLIWRRDSEDLIPAIPFFIRPTVVGTLWSTVASVRLGCRTDLLAARNPPNACGEVTSCTRWRST